jgi:hypothetical protein
MDPNKAARRVLYSGLPSAVPTVIYKEAHLGAVHKRRIQNIDGPFGDWARGDVLWDRVKSVDPADHRRNGLRPRGRRVRVLCR